MRSALGRVPNLYATIAHSPVALRGLLSTLSELQQGRLSFRESELIALRVAQLNGCGYCVAAHYVFAPQAGLSHEEIEAARAGHAAGVKDRAILDFVQRVVRTGGAGANGELAALRDGGVDDETVMEILMHVCLLSFMNAVSGVARPVLDFPEAPRAPQH